MAASAESSTIAWGCCTAAMTPIACCMTGTSGSGQRVRAGPPPPLLLQLAAQVGEDPSFPLEREAERIELQVAGLVRGVDLVDGEVLHLVAELLHPRRQEDRRPLRPGRFRLHPADPLLRQRL